MRLMHTRGLALLVKCCWHVAAGFGGLVRCLNTPFPLQLPNIAAPSAVLALQGKPVLGYVDLPSLMRRVNMYSSENDRLLAIDEITFRDLDAQWPPQRPMREDGTDSGFESDSKSACEPDSTGVPGGGRGERGWRDGDYIFAGDRRTPTEVQQLQGAASTRPVVAEGSAATRSMHPRGCWVSTDDNLLVTTDHSCRKASAREVQRFVASKSAHDGDRCDIHLTHAPTASRLYVFLATRLTGRPKASGPVATMAALC